jgi:hypothetical protein
MSTIKECPSCGAKVESFSTTCQYCGIELVNIDVSNAVNELVAKLEKAEEAARNDKSSGGFVGGLMKLIDGETALEKKIFNAKSNILSSYPIPNSKEDILEFLALSVSNVNSISINTLERMAGTSGTYGYKITYKNAWLGLANKAIIKARLSMKGDQKNLENIEGYAKQLKIK